MSRSKKKTPICGWTGGVDSEKEDKKIWHRQFRHKIKNILRGSHNDVDSLEEVVMPVRNEVSNIASMSKDGKHYFGNWLKKNLDMFGKFMRK